MAPQKTPQSRPRPPKSVPTPPAAAGRDLAEEAGGAFEEACDHVRTGERFARLELGPIVTVAPSDLRPGTFAWKCSVRSATTPASAAATLYYLVPDSGPKPKGPSPLRAFDWTEFAAVSTSRGTPPGTVLVRGGPPTSASMLTAFVHAIALELGRDDE